MFKRVKDESKEFQLERSKASYRQALQEQAKKAQENKDKVSKIQ